MSKPLNNFTDLDPVFHAPARLSIGTALAASRRGLSFSELKHMCDLTDGNLSRHITKLESEGLVSVEKSFVERRPLTAVSLTESGRERFLQYLSRLGEIVAINRNSLQLTAAPDPANG